MSRLRDALASEALDARHIGTVDAWDPPTPLWRMYSRVFGPAGFNATRHGYARFSPLTGVDGQPVPILYAGTTLDVALMEIVLRDVPTPSLGFQLRMPAPDAEPRRVKRLVPVVPLRMIDFSAIGLRRLGLDRGDVIDCDSAHYVDTQALAAWAHRCTATGDPSLAVHGIVWTSRQDDAGQAAMFFGDRLPPESLEAFDAEQRLHGGAVEAALLRLAARLGIAIVAG